MNTEKIFFTQVDREIRFWSANNYYPDINAVPHDLRDALTKIMRIVDTRQWICKFPPKEKADEVVSLIYKFHDLLITKAPELWVILEAFISARNILRIRLSTNPPLKTPEKTPTVTKSVEDDVIVVDGSDEEKEEEVTPESIVHDSVKILKRLRTVVDITPKDEPEHEDIDDIEDDSDSSEDASEHMDEHHDPFVFVVHRKKPRN